MNTSPNYFDISDDNIKTWMGLDFSDRLVRSINALQDLHAEVISKVDEAILHGDVDCESIIKGVGFLAALAAFGLLSAQAPEQVSFDNYGKISESALKLVAGYVRSGDFMGLSSVLGGARDWLRIDIVADIITFYTLGVDSVLAGVLNS